MNLNALFENRDSFASQLIRQKARQLVRHPGFSKSDREDIEQELATELIQKYASLDLDRACETTFVARVIESKAVSLVRARQAEKRHFRRNGKSLNERVSDGEGGSVERAQTVDATTAKRHTGQASRSSEEQAGLKLDVDELLSSLPTDLRQLAELLQQMSEHAASRALGKSRRQVAKDVARLRERFEDAGLRDYLDGSGPKTS
jgi:RNA polymerase sigma factor (sigma-70 family)